MTISTTTSRQSYNGNGVTTVFSVPFRFFANTDLVVQLVTVSTGASTTLTLTTHYTVTGADEEDGGSLTMLTAPAVGERLVIRRVIGATQEVDYVAGDPFPAETHERALDRLTMLAQQGEEVNARALVFPAGDTASGELPAVATRASKLLGFNSSGELTVSAPASGSAAELALDLASTASGKGAAMVGFIQAGADAVGRTVDEKLKEFKSVLDFFIAGEATATPMFQRALDAAKGADATGAGRTVFSLYVPTPASGYYSIDETLVIDGTHGIHIYGDSALTERESTFPTGALRWTGATSKPIIQIKGGTGTPSNPNFQIKISDLCISGHTSFIAPGSIPGNLALSGIHIGALDGQTENTLVRNLVLENVRITDCRFGVWGGNPDALNTDHAMVTLSNSMIYRNAQAGIVWGTGNAILAADGNFIGNNGWGALSFAADDYMQQKGANVYVNSGYVDLCSTTTAGAGAYKPVSADIYQESGRVSIINAWSDTEGYFFYQAGASTNGTGRHVGQITGVRHFNSSFDATNTPDSMHISVPGTVVSSCLVYGNIEVASGLSGRPVFSGINFARTGATFTGTGVTTQRTLIHIGHGGGNFAQMFTGGADTGVALAHKGNKPPQWLSMGMASGSLSLIQAMGAASTASGFQVKMEETTGQLQILVNGYFSGSDAATPLNINRAMFYYTLGGSTNMLTLWSHDPNGSAAEVALSTFINQGGFLSGNAGGVRSEVAFRMPMRASAPTYSSGDYWEGAIYYDTTLNKMRVNVGGSTWQTVTSA